MVEKVIQNDTAEPVFLQFDPWATTLYLLPSETLRIGIAEGQDRDYEIIKDSQDRLKTWYIWLPCADTFSILEGNRAINWLEYGSNVAGFSPFLHPASSLRGFYPPGQTTQASGN